MKFKKMSRALQICSILAGLIFISLLGIFFKLFIYGIPTTHYTVNMEVQDDGVLVRGELIDSAAVYSHYRVVERAGENQVVIYATMPLPWNHNGSFQIKLDDEKLKDNGLYVQEYKITKFSKIVSAHAARIYEKKHAYIGDMSKNDALAGEIGIASELGTYQNELQTKTKPYGWTLSFQNTWKEDSEAENNEKMTDYACILLAAVDNLREVTWTYDLQTADGIVNKKQNLTVGGADRLLGHENKKFGDDEIQMDELLTTCGIDTEKRQR